MNLVRDPSLLESIISTMLEAQNTAETLNWRVADMLLEGEEEFGKGFAKEIAAHTVWTTRHVRSLINVARTFTEEQRVPHLSFKVHGVCAKTSDPHRWLDKTVENNWSERQLKEAIKDSKDTGPTAEKAAKKGERIIKTIEEFHAEYKELAKPHLQRLSARLEELI